MGITEFITLILVILKLAEVITWSWYGVFALEAIAVFFYIIIIGLNVGFIVKTMGKVR